MSKASTMQDKVNDMTEKEKSTKTNKTKATTVKDSAIEKLKDTAKELIQKSEKNYYELGDTLIHLKLMLGHNNFSKWIDEEVHFSHNLANKYMRVVENYDQDTAIRLGIRKAYLLLKINKENRMKFIEDNNAYALSCSKLEELVKLSTSNDDAPRTTKGRYFVRNIDKFTSDLSSKIDEFIEYKLVAKDDDLKIINDHIEIFDKLIEFNDFIKSSKSKNDLEEDLVVKSDAQTVDNSEYRNPNIEFEEDNYYDSMPSSYYESSYDY